MFAAGFAYRRPLAASPLTRAMLARAMPRRMSKSAHLPLFHVVGFSGHRQLGRADDTAAAVRAALEALRSEGPGEWIALSSVASGGDTLFAKQALALGLAWHAVL